MPRRRILTSKAEKRVRVTDETFAKWREQREVLGFKFDEDFAQYLLRVGQSLQKLNMLQQEEGQSEGMNSGATRSVGGQEDMDVVKAKDPPPSGAGVSSSKSNVETFNQTILLPKEPKRSDAGSYAVRQLNLGWCTAEFDRQQVLSGKGDQKQFLAHLLNTHNQWCSSCRTSTLTQTATSLAKEKSEFATACPDLMIPTSWESKKWFQDLHAQSNLSVTSFMLHLLLIYSHWHSIPLPGESVVGEPNTDVWWQGEAGPALPSLGARNQNSRSSLAGARADHALKLPLPEAGGVWTLVPALQPEQPKTLPLKVIIKEVRQAKTEVGPATSGDGRPSHATPSRIVKTRKFQSEVSAVGIGQGQELGESSGQGHSDEEGEGSNEDEDTEENSDADVSDFDKADLDNDSLPPLYKRHVVLKNFTLYDERGEKLDSPFGIMFWGSSWVPEQFECKRCLRLEKTWRSALDHWKVHDVLTESLPEVFLCALCEKRTMTVTGHVAHLEKCKKKLDCPLCDFSVDPKEYERYKLVLKAHKLEKHHQAKSARRHLCEECGEAFECPAHLKEHFNEKHDPNPTLFKCPFCDETYKSSRKLRFHKRYKHCDKKSLACPECHHIFCRDEALKLHIDRVHRKVKNHRCTYEGCGAEFFNTRGLRMHIDNHHLRLPATLPCKWKGCTKMFRNEYNLKIHMRVHTDEKPLKCVHCDYRARQRAAMNWHMKKHADIGGDDPKTALLNEKERSSSSQSESQGESVDQPLEGGASAFRVNVPENMGGREDWGSSPEKHMRLDAYPGFPSYPGYM